MAGSSPLQGHQLRTLGHLLELWLSSRAQGRRRSKGRSEIAKSQLSSRRPALRKRQSQTLNRPSTCNQESGATASNAGKLMTWQQVLKLPEYGRMPSACIAAGQTSSRGKVHQLAVADQYRSRFHGVNHSFLMQCLAADTPP